ncbi:hypothetical protein M9H77_32311 [Catharanthus roseus]|uniref:Uncharacterized protein n=1 Tax=Catharanthus roseus TaxID=4058 RepID=A0ACC0A4K5_CATRO|nr:hypothetical protein M9H77_32311 [Catharanthus roseus]
MDCPPEPNFSQRRRILVIFWLLLMITTTWSRAKGRAIPNLVKVEKAPESTEIKKTEEENVVMEKRVLIGSRPPRCERRCSSCRGPCEAVQVPIVPSNKLIRSQHLLNASPLSIAYYSRGSDISNYKPMCWKCKCGNFMFNP